MRAKVIGEGGNLGVTALGRVEFDLSGGRINTDALDNSAGVDCSDHEVNIKILIDSLVSAGTVKADERTQLLESMTDEVAQLVLADNEDQNDLMGTSRANAASLLPVHAMQIKYLVAERGSTANWKRCRRRRRLPGAPRPASGSPRPNSPR
ncbi:NAD-dependent glutamate dehydrogenase [Mycobacterium tuberculosis variant bovis BCG]|nr:NAD-dependent glutamate dehydrogenase [Mycobacterium tuberculosis variant bovis BCG]